MRIQASVVAVSGFLAVALIGCGGDARGPRGTVRGVVKYEGTPLSSGTVVFHGPENRGASAQIQADGSYSVADAAIGDNKITVTTPPPPAVKVETAPLPGTKSVTSIAIPTKYGIASKSELTFEVKNGDQTFDIQLKK